MVTPYTERKAGVGPATYQKLINQNRLNVERVQNQQPDFFHQVGKALITTVGEFNESTFAITFNYTFIEEPLFTSGVVLDYGQKAIPKQFPIISVMVVEWTQDTGGQMLIPSKAFSAYTGATLGVTTNDPALGGTRFWVHYMLSGRVQKFSNAPGPPTTTATGTA